MKLLPCPNHIVNSLLYAEKLETNKRENQFVIKCNVCGKSGPRKNSIRKSELAWNEIVRRIKNETN